MALKFNGTSDYVDLGNSATLRPAGDMTVVAWVYFNSTAVDQWVIARDDNTLGRDFAFGLSSAGPRVEFQAAGTAQIGGAANVSAGKWIHIAASHVVGSQWIGYSSGIATVGSLTTLQGTTATGSTTIGKRTFSGFNDWTGGKIAHAAIYNAALSANEIALLAAGNSPLAVRTSDLLGYWPLDGAQGAAGFGQSGALGILRGPTPDTDPPSIIRYPSRVLAPIPAEGEMPALSAAAAPAAPPWLPQDNSRNDNIAINSRRIAASVLIAASAGLTLPLSPPPAPAAVPQGWQTVSTYSPSVTKPAPTQATSFATPAQAGLTPSQFGWYQPLSKAVAVAQAKQGVAFVPFNTAQAATPTPSQFGWYAPLSKAVSVTQAQQGNTSVPFNTVQTATAPIPVALVYDAGYPRTTVVYYQSRFNALPPIAPPQNTVVQVTWQQPLSVAVKSPPPDPTQATSFATPTQTIPTPTPGQFGWYSPLSKAVAVAIARPGTTFVPFNTVQPSNSISTFGWFSPLSKPAPVALPNAGYAFVPFDTPQVVPPPVIIPPPFHGWTPATKNIETWSAISNVNGLWIPAIKNIEGWT